MKTLIIGGLITFGLMFCASMAYWIFAIGYAASKM